MSNIQLIVKRRYYYVDDETQEIIYDYRDSIEEKININKINTKLLCLIINDLVESYNVININIKFGDSNIYEIYNYFE